MNYDGDVADAYARSRDTSAAVVHALCRRAQITAASRVLEVGCGTAAYLRDILDATGCCGYGVDPSHEMRRCAVPRDRMQLFAGTAESLPFDDASFDLVLSVDVIHHVGDLHACYEEAGRVLSADGMVCTVTDSHEMIRTRRPLSAYWPSSAAADLARYPGTRALMDAMADAGFVDIEERAVRESFALTDPTPSRRKAFSCLHLIPEAEFADGLERLESDLRAGPVEGVRQYACVWGRRR